MLFASLWLLLSISHNKNLFALADEVKMGTTIVAVRTKQGVVIGADTRTSVGVMVSNRYANKLSFVYQDGPVSCVLCRSGSAADTQYLADEAQWEFRSRALRYGMTKPSVSQIARWFRYVVMNGSYSASLLCVGYDPQDGGRIYSILPSGSLIEEQVYATGGSGSTYIIGLMDKTLKTMDDNNLMEEKEAIDFVTESIQAAMERDHSSGGFARLVVMNRDGARELTVLPKKADLLGLASTGKELKGFQSATRASLPGKL